ncbi:MAG: hypothetical protein K1X50_06200 [Candidatus Promineofilum sp.]|nr:hypothetical protein [Promineifilum sp.]MCW5862020.1 hypothetical protein [Anaerolineae bacterium]
MPEAHYQPGQSFPIQFAWRLPAGEYLRAVFQADVLELAPAAEKYVVRLSQLVAGREETTDGQPKPPEALSRDYWRLVGGLIGRRITLAYEADDGRALYMRLETLTGEHNYFSRYEDAEVIARGIEARLKKLRARGTAGSTEEE